MRIDFRRLFKLPKATLALAAFNAGLLIYVVMVVFNGTRASELLGTPALSPEPLGIELDNASAPRDLTAIQERPLMHTSRTFNSAPTPDAAPQPPPLADYRLAGSFLAPKKPPVALLATPHGGAPRRVRAGDDLDGWRVDSISSRRVVLRWKELTREISATPQQFNAGLTRVPMQRQRIAGVSGSVVSLGATGGTISSSGGQSPIPSDPPRFYRPPPN